MTLLRVAKLCPIAGCGAITLGGRCSVHREPHPNQHRDERRKRDGRTTAAWQRTRLRVLARDYGLCVHCGTTATIVDKITGGYHTQNLNDYQSLCHTCSGKKDARRKTDVPHKDPPPEGTALIG